MSLILIFCTPRPRDNIYEFSGFCKISPLRGCESLRVETQVMAGQAVSVYQGRSGSKSPRLSSCGDRQPLDKTQMSSAKPESRYLAILDI